MKKINAVAFEDRMRSYPYPNVEVAGRSTPWPHGTPSRQAKGRPLVDAGSHLDSEGALFDAPTLAATTPARVRYDLSTTRTRRTGRAGHHLAQHRLANPLNLTGTTASTTRLGT